MDSNARFNHYDNLCLDWYRYVFANQRRNKVMDEREKIKQQAAVMLAFAEGKEIEVRNKTYVGWRQIFSPAWDWSCNEYRVRPKPPRKFVRYYVCVIQTGNLLGGFITKEAAEISCASYNRGCKVPEFNVVAFELTEIKENAA